MIVVFLCLKVFFEINLHYDQIAPKSLKANSGIAERQFFIWHIVSPDFMA